MEKLKVLNGALDEHNGNIVLRGIISHESYDKIIVPSYQRERRSVGKLKTMIQAIKEGKQLPDIEIGIRGSGYSEEGGIFLIPHSCAVVDGLQRLTACQRALAEKPELNIRLGAMLHFGTTEKWEKDRFKTVNGGDGSRVAVSSNVMLRNSADESISVSSLLKMSEDDKEFVLKGLVSWNQNKSKGELITGMTLLKIIGVLHRHFGPGRSNRHNELMKSCDKTLGVVGVNNWKSNVRTFFDLVDQAFGLKSIRYTDLSVHILQSFLLTLAQVLADHANFWDGNKLTIEKRDVGKLKQFPINDPGVVTMIKSSGNANPILYNHLVSHMDSGRRTNRLKKWNGQAADGLMTQDVVESEDFQDSQA